jgi:hypothetical protein
VTRSKEKWSKESVTQQKKSAVIQQMLKVFYAPHKAFKEIKDNPRYIGPILVMVLFIAANTGVAYVIMSKSYIEQTLPTAKELDSWTENATLWRSSPEVRINESDDHIDGAYYGNRSIEFSAANDNHVSMWLNNTGSVNCSVPDGYKNLSLRIKLTEPLAKPESVSIYLFSSTPSDYLYHDLTGNFSSSTGNIWNNLTISLADDTWSTNGTNGNWGNITGLKLEFGWLENSNITLLVDGLFFRGIFKTYPEIVGMTYVLNSLSSGLSQFVIQWVFLGVIAYVIVRVLGSKTSWKSMLILAGFALITLFVQSMVNAIVFSTVSKLYYPLEYLGGVQGESSVAYKTILEQTNIVSLVSNYLQIAANLWTIGLCTIAIRSLTEFSWTKSIAVAAVSVFAGLFLMGVIFGI